MLANTMQGFGYFVPILWLPSAFHLVVSTRYDIVVTIFNYF